MPRVGNNRIPFNDWIVGGVLYGRVTSQPPHAHAQIEGKNLPTMPIKCANSSRHPGQLSFSDQPISRFLYIYFEMIGIRRADENSKTSLLVFVVANFS
jgi:hypothetical protein